ncbi:hypothetical protein MMC07_005323 [Pseudocyphellaria aurata]|nr:hypothetical protein [Pseudocyphellaria aurata]
MSKPIPKTIPQSQQATRSHPRVKRSAPTPTTHRAIFSRHSSPNLTAKSNFLLRRRAASPQPPSPKRTRSRNRCQRARIQRREFHVYKASRRREYERVTLMAEEIAREEADEHFLSRRDVLRKQDREKTDKRRRKREKVKGRKGARNNGDGGGGVDLDGAMEVSMEDRDGDDEVKAVDDVGVISAMMTKFERNRNGLTDRKNLTWRFDELLSQASVH